MQVSSIGNPVPVLERIWKPTDKQQQVLSLPDTVFEALGGGAAGGGKTDLGLMLPIARQFHEHPKFKALILRRTFADLEKEIVPRQQEWYAPSGGTYNETKKVWVWGNGARIQNGHAEREQDVRKYDSAEYNYIDWDESTHFTGFQYLYLSFSRCRSSSPDLPAFVRSFTNPGNVGHGFFKQRFVDPCPFGRKILLDKITKQKRIYIPFLGRDNPHLLLNDPGYLTRLESLPEVEKKAKLFGDWNSYEGQVFTEFRAIKLPDEPDNALHVIQPFAIPTWWPRFLCVDWGWKALTFAIWAAVSPDGRCYIYRTAAWKETVIKSWTRDIVNYTGSEQLEDVGICHSAGQHRGEEKTVQEQVYEAFEGKYGVRLAQRDRIGGKALIHEYLRWRQIPKINPNDITYNAELASKILRVHGEDKYNEYLSMFREHEPETNIPKLLIFSHSIDDKGNWGRENKELIDCIPACIPDEKNPEDVAAFPGDDPYDCLRMVMKMVHHYTDQSRDKMAHMQRLEKLHALNTASSQTAYYLELERNQELEEEIGSVPRHRMVGVRRFVR